MASHTVVVLPPKERPEIRPIRSMTHPLRDPKSNGAKRRVKKGEQFDPEELSRRLTAHLAEQKLKAERRRDARAAKAAAAQQNNVYHHVPKVAATAFERTTTPDVLRHHKLSQPALNQHLERLSLDDPNPQITGLKKIQALDQAVLERDMLRNRNQFQWNHDMEVAAEVDVNRNVYKLPQRTFNFDLAPRSRHEKALSTGEIFWDEDEPPVAIKAKSPLKPVFDGRNDWAQQDEGERGLTKEKSTPFLRKRDSIWILGSRKEKPKRDKDEAVAEIGDFGSPPPGGTKSGKIGFLARFKRHPS